MTQEETQRALEDGRTLESNGFRVYLDARRLVVQDLIEGWWAELGTYAVRATTSRPAFRAVAGKADAIATHPRLAAALGPDALAGLGGGTVAVGALAARLLTGDHPHPTAASRLVPALAGLRRLATPYINERPDDVAVAQVAAVVTALAHAGGRADQEWLVAALGAWGRPPAAARTALEVATRRGAVRCLDPRAPLPTYALRPASPAWG